MDSPEDDQSKYVLGCLSLSLSLANIPLIFIVGNLLSIPVYTTTQNSARLGPPCSELFPSSPPSFLVDKTAFSMMVPELRSKLEASSSSSYQVAIVGIETHICVTQTALDLLADGHKVYVLADGVSSCHEGERGIALDRLRQEGATITTSESFLYECMGDASTEESVFYSFQPFFVGKPQITDWQ